MQTARWQHAVRGILVGLSLLSAAAVARAETLVENSNEVRFQFDFKISDAALAAVLPKGFTSDVATTGPAKDCNIRVVFIDRVTINGPDNNPKGVGTEQLVYLVAPVKDPTGASVQLVIGGITADPTDAPGPFGNYLPATTHSVRRATATPKGGGPMLESQDWSFAAAGGEHFEMHITYARGDSNYRPQMDRKYYSAKNSTFYQISRETEVLDILRNLATNPPDKVKTFSFKGGGGTYAKLFDGSEKTLSWDNILWINRAVLLP